MIIASKDKTQIIQTGKNLGESFQLTNLGKLNHYLGIQIDQDKDGIFSINQEQYIEEMLRSTGLKEAKPSKIPLDPGYVKAREDEEPMEDNNSYRKLIGKLLYIAINTRPDIAASVSFLSQHNVGATETNWNEAKRIARYLKRTKKLKFKLGGTDCQDKESLIVYADADWAQSREDRKSNSDFLFKLNEAIISWTCKKQDCVALSSTEAEHIALAEAAQEGTWIRQLFKDFNQDRQGPTKIF